MVVSGGPDLSPASTRYGDRMHRTPLVMVAVGLVAALDAVVVLGYRNRGARANYINRYRVRAGLRSLDPATDDSVLVLCGGTVAGEA